MASTSLGSDWSKEFRLSLILLGDGDSLVSLLRKLFFSLWWTLSTLYLFRQLVCPRIKSCLTRIGFYLTIGCQKSTNYLNTKYTLNCIGKHASLNFTFGNRTTSWPASRDWRAAQRFCWTASSVSPAAAAAASTEHLSTYSGAPHSFYGSQAYYSHCHYLSLFFLFCICTM